MTDRVTKLEKVTHLYSALPKYRGGERVEMHLRATVDGSYFHHDVTITARQGYAFDAERAREGGPTWEVEVNRPGGITDADDAQIHAGLLLLAAVEARALKRMLDEGEIAFPLPDRDRFDTAEELPVELLDVLEGRV